MASLQTLPTELFDKILLQVSHSDVLSLSLTSKRLQSATEEELYNNIKWTWDGGIGSTARVPLDLLRPRSIPISPLYLLRTILRRPNLALRVAHLSINFDPSWQDLGCEPPLYPRDFLLVDELVQQAQLPDPESWKSAIARGSIDGAVALLVSQLSNLKTLSVGYNSFFTEETGTKDTLLGAVLQHTVIAGPTARISRFPRLSEVSLTAGRPSYQLQRPVSCLALLHAPNLQSATFAVDYAHEGRRLRQIWLAAPPCAAALTTLRFKISPIGADALEQILPSTPNLKTLELDHRFQRNLPGFHGKYLTTVLKNCKATLERVVIATSLLPDYGFDHPRDWITCAMDPLREFSALRYLEIDLLYLTVNWGCLTVDWSREPAEDLALSDILPPNINTLRIRHDFMHYPWHRNDISKRIYESLEPFLPQVSSCAPELREIEILERCGEPVRGCYKDDVVVENSHRYWGDGSDDSDEDWDDDGEETNDEVLRYSRKEINELCEGYNVGCKWIRLRKPCASLEE